jgi:tRNA 2-thiouridine synthesizing protein E
VLSPEQSVNPHFTGDRMPIFESGDLRVAIDDKGYLIDFDSWTREIAVALAASEEITALTAAHWAVIEFLRRYQAEHGVAPMIRVLCRESGLTLQQIYELFPSGPARGACRVAGLPRPDSCV